MSTHAAAKEASELSRKAELLITLGTFTQRDLRAQPPQDAETLVENLGVGANNLDRFVRPWMNKRFIRPDGKPALPPGALDAKTTFKQACDFVGA